MYFLAADGEPLSFEAVREEWKLICEAHIDRGQYLNVQWAIVGCDINYEDPELYCAHTGKRIESAYAEPE
jgi:hypothetical protein